jgi:hypothetical protein
VGGYNGEALGINDAGSVTGALPNVDYGLYGPTTGAGPCTSHAFIYTSGGAYLDLAPGYGTAINANGSVTGNTFESVKQSGQFATVDLGAFIYDAGTFTLLGAGTEWGYGINASNFVVGDGTSSTGVGFAFLYSGVVSDLNTFILPADPLHGKVRLTDARGINDSGLVIVNGVNLADNTSHAYLLQVPLLNVVPPPIFYVPVGNSSQQTVTLTNMGTSPITLGSPSISGGTGFSVASSTCGASLALQCALNVQYQSSGTGTAASTLTILADGVPIAVPLSAYPPITATISSSAASTFTGTPVTLTWSASAGATCTATGGSANDGWGGSIAANGSQKVTETTPGDYQYGLQCSAGTESHSDQVSVIVTYPPPTVKIAASPTSMTTGSATTVTWSSANATSCSSTGGGSGDGWASTTRPTSGSVPLTESGAITSGSSQTLTFTINCTSTLSGKSAAASVQVIQNAPGSGGGGGVGASVLLMLGGLLPARQLTRTARP